MRQAGWNAAKALSLTRLGSALGEGQRVCGSKTGNNCHAALPGDWWYYSTSTYNLAEANTHVRLSTWLRNVPSATIPILQPCPIPPRGAGVMEKQSAFVLRGKPLIRWRGWIDLAVALSPI